MKINLTRLLEFSSNIKHSKKEDSENCKTGFVTMVSNYERTSSDITYSFELEKEVFNLE